MTAVEKYKHYFADKHFVVFTDHISLKWLRSIKDTRGRLGWWSLVVQSYNFEIKHKTGKTNTNADFLPRRKYDQDKPQNCLKILPALTTLFEFDDSDSRQQITTLEYVLEFDDSFRDTAAAATVNGVDLGDNLTQEERL